MKSNTHSLASYIRHLAVVAPLHLANFGY